jgi:hypothetical protein
MVSGLNGWERPPEAGRAAARARACLRLSTRRACVARRLVRGLTLACAPLIPRGDVTDSVVMEGKNYGFATFRDPAHAMAFLEVRVVGWWRLVGRGSRCRGARRAPTASSQAGAVLTTAARCRSRQLPLKILLCSAQIRPRPAEICSTPSRWTCIAHAPLPKRPSPHPHPDPHTPRASPAPQHGNHTIRGRRVDAKAAVPKHLGGNAKLTRKLFVGGTRCAAGSHATGGRPWGAACREI